MRKVVSPCGRVPDDRDIPGLHRPGGRTVAETDMFLKVGDMLRILTYDLMVSGRMMLLCWTGLLQKLKGGRF